MTLPFPLPAARPVAAPLPEEAETGGRNCHGVRPRPGVVESRRESASRAGHPPEGSEVPCQVHRGTRRQDASLLTAWRAGDPAALERLLPLVYTELHRLAHRHMRGERPDRHTLQTTALVNEAYLRLVHCRRVCTGRTARILRPFSPQLMRRILVDAARGRAARASAAARPCTSG